MFVLMGFYRENAIAIESEARDPNSGNVYYVTMQITFHIPEFARKERNLHCDVVTLPPFGSLDSFWIMRSQRSRRRDKALLCCCEPVYFLCDSSVHAGRQPNDTHASLVNIEHSSAITK